MEPELFRFATVHSIFIFAIVFFSVQAFAANESHSEKKTNGNMQSLENTVCIISLETPEEDRSQVVIHLDLALKLLVLETLLLWCSAPFARRGV